MSIYSLYQVNNTTPWKKYLHKKNSFWCLNLNKNILEKYNNFGVVHNNRINYLNKKEIVVSNNLIYKHINTALQIFEYVRINDSGRAFNEEYLNKEFDVCFIDENDFVIKRSELTIFWFLVLEKYFLRAFGLLEECNVSFLKQINTLNNIENLISKDMQFGFSLKGLTAGLFDFSPALNKKLEVLCL